MRETILDCCHLDWGKISPAIFGSLFQSIMDRSARRRLGAHYTSEINILKALRPLFLDDLKEEYERIKKNNKRLFEFHQKLAKIRILDPACGCGNFLVIAYRELRLLELEVLRQLMQHNKSGHLDVSSIVLVDVDQFYGIELEEFPAQISQVALWLTDHQMNSLVSGEFGQYFARLPLKKAPMILQGNALEIEWRDLVNPDQLSYIVGNPPFVGAKYQSEQQRDEVRRVFSGVSRAGLLDYVSCWYIKSVEYMEANRKIRAALVSTNSITQGEQVGVLWSELFSRGVEINFAHRTFQWMSKGRGTAAVHCVIVGFALEKEKVKRIFEYEHLRAEPHEIVAKDINPYLVDGPKVVLIKRKQSICGAPKIGIGNKPIDGGNYLFTPEEKAEFLKIEPSAEKWFKRWIGSIEFINKIERWCLWLGDCAPSELRKMPEVMKRVEAVRKVRSESKSAPTRRIADTPTRFHVENIPEDDFLVIPEVSSEKRDYIPIGFIHPDTLASNLVKVMPNATLYHFGIMTSLMHMAWVRAVAGRLKSDYRYSVDIVYNNFPWASPTKGQRDRIEQAAEKVLETREKYPDSTLADLYDPNTTPSDLRKAHRELDRVVDLAYTKTKFHTEPERVAYLLNLYSVLAI